MTTDERTGNKQPPINNMIILDRTSKYWHNTYDNTTTQKTQSTSHPGKVSMMIIAFSVFDRVNDLLWHNLQLTNNALLCMTS